MKNLHYRINVAKLILLLKYLITKITKTEINEAFIYLNYIKKTNKNIMI